MDLLVLDLRSVPASAQRFHQVHLGDHLLAGQLRQQPLIAEQGRLRGDHVEVAGHPADIAVVSNLQGASRVGHRGVLGASRLR